MLTALDRLFEAEEAEKGLRLSASDVADLVEEFHELELARELDAIFSAKVIEELTGEKAKFIN